MIRSVPSLSELPGWLNRKFSFVGDTVVDPFVGTGTTLAAAMIHGRNSIGFEVDRTYARAACKRIQDQRGIFCSADLRWQHLSHASLV